MRKLHAALPRLVDAGGREDVRRPRPLADAGVAVAAEEGLALLSAFLKRLRAPAEELAALDVPPDVGVLHPVLEVAVGRPNGRILPGRDEDAERGRAVRIDVEEAEDLRLGEAERVDDRAGFQLARLRQLHDGLHPDAPVVAVMPLRKPELRVERAPDGAHGAIRHDGQRGLDVHARHERALHRRPVLLHALVRKAHAHHGVAREERFGDGRARHDHEARLHHLLGGPRHEGSHRQHEAAALVHERRRERQLARVPFPAAHEEAAQLETEIAEAREGRTLRRAQVVEKVGRLLLADGGAVRDLLRQVDAGEGAADRSGLRDDAGDAEAGVVGALVAHDLEGTARHGLRLVERRAVLLRLRERGAERREEPGGGGAKSRHHDIRLHLLSLRHEIRPFSNVSVRSRPANA